MKAATLSNCENSFINQTIKQYCRLDGRKNDEFRNLKINFGLDFGSVLVALGESKVLAQVSCELGEPKATRPHEGMMFINVDIDSGRNSELVVKINRTLERTFKDSRCVDLESLCVLAEEKVWILRVDLNVLCNAGNLIDCCSFATLLALGHFKRPDVSLVEDQVHIHTAAEKEPIAIVLHHYPVCISYCIFDEGRLAVVDPSTSEERTAESEIIFGLNSFRELCCVNLGGATTLANSNLFLQCAAKAASHSKAIVEYIKEALEADTALRKAGKTIGFTECLRSNTFSGLKEDRLDLRLRYFHFGESNGNSKIKVEDFGDADIKSNFIESDLKWIPNDVDEDDEDTNNIVDMDSDNDVSDIDNDDFQVEEALKRDNQRSNQPISKHRLLGKKNLEQLTDDIDSEEEQKQNL